MDVPLDDQRLNLQIKHLKLVRDDLTLGDDLEGFVEKLALQFDLRLFEKRLCFAATVS